MATLSVSLAILQKHLLLFCLGGDSFRGRFKFYDYFLGTNSSGGELFGRGGMGG